MGGNHYLLTNLLSPEETKIITCIVKYIEKGERRVSIQQLANENSQLKNRSRHWLEESRTHFLAASFWPLRNSWDITSNIREFNPPFSKKLQSNKRGKIFR